MKPLRSLGFSRLRCTPVTNLNTQARISARCGGIGAEAEGCAMGSSGLGGARRDGARAFRPETTPAFGGCAAVAVH
jgi:hypothetical protein